MSKRNREVRRESGRFLRSWWEQHVGAYISGIWAYTKWLLQSNRFNSLFKRVMLVAGGLLCISGAYMIGHNLHAQQQMTRKINGVDHALVTQKQIINQQNRQLAKFNFGLDEPTRQAYAASTTLFDAMYDYQDGTAYVKHRKQALKKVDITRVTTIDQLYATGLDQDGANMITNLKQVGHMMDCKLYATSSSDTKNNIVDVDALVTYSATNDLSMENTNHDRLVQYNVRFDASRQKIIGLTKLGNYSKLNATSEGE